MVGGRQAGIGVCPEGSSEEEDEGLWFMYFVVDPSSRLLDSDGSPLLLDQESPTLDLLVDVLGQEDVPVFEEVVLVFLRVFYLVRKVGHVFSKYSEEIYKV